MPDGETTARARGKRPKAAQNGLGTATATATGTGRGRRPPAARPEPEPAFARREVVVQGMRITLPALRFMETAPPPARPR